MLTILSPCILPVAFARANRSFLRSSPPLLVGVRQRGEIGARRFEIEFLDPGAEAFAFTFG